MKFNSNFSNAKTNTVKSIGKVLLPVVLLLVAILAIGISASAALAPELGDVCPNEGCSGIYTETYPLPGAEHLLICNNGHTVKAPCRSTGYYADCAESTCVDCKDVIPAGTFAAHTWATENSDFAGKIPAAESLIKLKDKAKCYNGATFYTFCLECGAFNPDASEKLTFDYHVFDQKVANDATLISQTGVCGQPMYFWYSCTCGKLSCEDVESYNYEAFFTTGGRVYGHTYITDAVDIADKAEAAGVAMDDILVSGLPCGGDAVYRVFCEYCGNITEDTVKGSTTGSHTNKTSYNNDYHISSCIYCGKIASMAEHTKASGKPNCTNDIKCTGCSYVFEAKLGHQWEKVEAKAATCDANGTKEYWVCTREGCSIAAKKYTKNDGKTAYEDNFSDKGYKILAKGHVAAEGTNACYPGNCTVCGNAITKAEHIFPDGNYCDAECYVCKNVRRNHEYTVNTKSDAGTKCGEDGFATWTKCEHCGNVKPGSKVSYKTCQYKASDISINCTVSADKKCVNCGVAAGAEVTFHQLPAGTNVEALTCLSKVYCTKCGQNVVITPVVYTAHDIGEILNQDPTCTEKGFDSVEYCKQTFTINGTTHECSLVGACVNEKAPTGHKLIVDEVASVAADCKNEGKLVYKCEYCNNTLMSADEKKALVTVLAVNHASHVIVSRYTADKHWTECTVCGITTDAVAHTWKDGKAADCENGATCTVCKYTVAKLGHQDKDNNGKKKYVTYADGHEEVCHRCGTVLVPKVAHTEKAVADKAAKACATGLTGKTECSVCKYVINAGTVVPMTGDGTHTWVWKRCDKNGKNADTKTNNTYHIQECSVCKKTQSKAACTDDGKQSCATVSSCKVCKQPLVKANTSTLSKPALGHTFTKNTAMVSTKDGHGFKCDRCGIVASEAHDTVEEKATCVAAAECSVCKYVVAPKADHVWATTHSSDEYGHYYACTGKGCKEKKDYESHVKPENYVRDCTTQFVCDVCGGDIAGFREGGHEKEFVRGVAATATMDGYTSHDVCKYCGMKFGFEVIPATGSQGGETPVQPADPLDFDGDGDVDEDDAVNIFVEILCGSTESVYDYNKDGKVDIKDAFAILLSVIMA